MVVQASKFNLPNPSLSSAPVSSLLFEPHSLSLALMHSDSSFSLHPSFSPLSLPSLPHPQTSIPPPSSSSTFVLLQQNPDSDPRILFLSSAPYNSGSQILLRFFILNKTRHSFSKPQICCTQKDLHFDKKLGVLIDSTHGVSIKLSGSVNFFAMYSVSSLKIWVFALKLVGNDDDGDLGIGVSVKLMRCAVIECCKPVWSITISFGLLILGEQSGVRVLKLKNLMKGKGKQARSSHLKLEDRIGCEVNGSSSDRECVERNLMKSCNGCLDGKMEKRVSAKQSFVRCREDSREGVMCFVAFKGKEVENSRTKAGSFISVKALSVQALSLKKFLVLDSVGDLHVLFLSNSRTISVSECCIRRLPSIMKVQKLAVLPGTQTVWISDGHHSVHLLSLSDMDAAASENDRTESEEEPVQISVNQAIFAAEKVQDIVPFAADASLVLGQGSIYAYSIH